MALRIRGRDPAATTVDQWDRAMTALLETAVAYGRATERVRRQRAWLAEHPDDPRYVARRQTAHRTLVARNELGGRMMDQAERVNALQRGLPAASRDGLGALLGGELTPYLANALAMAAARLQTTDLFAVMAAVLMEDDDATGDGVDDGGS